MWSTPTSLSPVGVQPPTVTVVATEEAVTMDFVTTTTGGCAAPPDRPGQRIAELSMATIRSIELEGRTTKRSRFDWELLTGFPVEREPEADTTGMLIASYQGDIWVLRLDGNLESVVPRMAELLARKERR